MEFIGIFHNGKVDQYNKWMGFWTLKLLLQIDISQYGFFDPWWVKHSSKERLLVREVSKKWVLPLWSLEFIEMELKYGYLYCKKYFDFVEYDPNPKCFFFYN